MKIADLSYQHALDKLASVGFEKLSEDERVVATIWHIEAGVNGGGFGNYFSSTGGDLAIFAPAALRRIGAHDKASIVEEANALFGPTGPSRDRSERLKMLKALNKESLLLFDQLEARYFDDPLDIDDLIEAFAARRKGSLS